MNAGMNRRRHLNGPLRPGRIALILGALIVGGASFTWVLASTLEGYVVRKNSIETAHDSAAPLGEAKRSWMF